MVHDAITLRSCDQGIEVLVRRCRLEVEEQADGLEARRSGAVDSEGAGKAGKRADLAGKRGDRPEKRADKSAVEPTGRRSEATGRRSEPTSRMSSRPGAEASRPAGCRADRAWKRADRPGNEGRAASPARECPFRVH